MPRKFIKRTTTRRRPKKSNAVATKAYVKSVVAKNVETKVNDSFRLEQTSTTIGVPYYQDDMMTLSNQEQTDSGILGSTVKNIGLSMKFIANNNSNSIGCFIRVLLLTNKLGKTNTDYRNGTNIFDFDGTNQSTTGALIDMHRMISKSQYIVHYDRVFKLGTSPADASQFLHGSFYLPMKGTSRYDQLQTTNTTEPYLNNKVLLILAAEAPNDLGIGTTIECSTTCRFYYKDA